MTDHPRIGISACLVGEPVRFNGQHCRQNDLLDALGAYVTWHPICPEMEMGLGAPRETMRLVRDPATEQVHLRTNKGGEDLTALAETTARRLVAPDLALDGYILKKDSPSCGLERVRLYTDGVEMPSRTGVGFFARALRERFPLLPVIEEGRLTDPTQREHFVTRVFAYHRLRQVPPDAAELQAFHRRHKLLLMAHSPSHYREAGRVVGTADGEHLLAALADYARVFTEGLAVPSTRGKRTNVLHHMLGYFKEQLSAEEKQHLLAVIEDYRQGLVPAMAPLGIIEHLIARHEVPYLADQVLFLPHPKALALRHYL